VVLGHESLILAFIAREARVAPADVWFESGAVWHRSRPAGALRCLCQVGTPAWLTAVALAKAVKAAKTDPLG